MDHEMSQSIAISNLLAGHISIALGGAKIEIGPESGLPSLTAPTLKYFKLSDARDERGIDLFTCLHWKYWLTEHLVAGSDAAFGLGRTSSRLRGISSLAITAAASAAGCAMRSTS
jgi:hypothetical protein